jgi:DNA anti-recombination protein RmuC
MLDLAQLIEDALRQWSPNTVVNAFVFALLAVFLATLWARWHGRTLGFVHYAPNLLTTMGILGTFVGIVIGLLAFDVSDIDASMGPLLNGLKTAFITSLVGIALAILFKSIDTSGKFIKKTEEAQVHHVGPEEIHEELRSQSEALEKLARSISGDDDSTLVTQIQKLRSQNHDDAKEMTNLLKAQAEFQATLSRASTRQAERFETFTEDLWKKLDDFAEMLSKSATEQVINALKEVIADFNRNLTEQFGDNFKQLNEAVEKLVDWQENYREQLGHMIDQYTHGVEAISDTSAAVALISEESKQIPIAMGELKTVLETTQHQLNELERHLEAFRDMRDRAVEAVPQIQKQMNAMVKDVSTAVKDAGEQIMSSSQAAHQAIVDGAREFATVTESTKSIGDTLVNANKNLENNIKEVQYQVTDSIQAMQKRLEGVFDEVVQAQTRTMARAHEALDEELRKSVGRTNEAVNKQLEAMDEAIQQELQRIIKAFGENLGGVTNRFAEDYARLTDQMARVVLEVGRFDQRTGTAN